LKNSLVDVKRAFLEGISIVAGEIPPGCHPLGRNNKIIFASGLIAGTNAANSGILLE